jgi:hypothetical protein
MLQPSPRRRLKQAFCGSITAALGLQPREAAAVATDAGNMEVAGSRVAGPAADGDVVASGFHGAAFHLRLLSGEVAMALPQMEAPHHAA